MSPTRLARFVVAAGTFLLTGCPLTASDDYEIGTGVGATGTGGAGAAGGGGAGGTTSGALASCPDDLPGPDLASVVTSSGDVYCMDTTEVTNGQYDEFLAATGPFEQHEACDWNDSFVPQGDSPGLTNPVVFVDWCDAHAYCTYAGKRLCGAIGGGAADFDNTSNPNDQWFHACSPNGRIYPYGDSYAAGRCNTVDNNQGQVIGVGSELSCYGAFDEIFDLSGNIIEWTDACNGNTGPDDACRNRNGSFLFGETESACEFSWGDRRDDAWEDTGFRCCLDVAAECAELSCLSTEGLVVRYAIDEAEEGQGPTQLEDSADDPLPLPITYSPGMTYVSPADHRGIHWNAAGTDGMARLPLDGTKIDTMLNGSTGATIELVMSVEQVSNATSRFLHVGAEEETGFFSLTARGTDELVFYVNTDLSYAARLRVDLATAERRVYHLVLDTTQELLEERVKAYVDGWLTGWNGGQPPEVGVPIDMGTGRDFVLGNRTLGQRSFQGTLFYAAVYARAFSPSDVVGHAAVLLQTDDAE